MQTETKARKDTEARREEQRERKKEKSNDFGLFFSGVKCKALILSFALRFYFKPFLEQQSQSSY